MFSSSRTRFVVLFMYPLTWELLIVCAGSFQTMPRIVVHFNIFRLAKEKYWKVQKDI